MMSLLFSIFLLLLDIANIILYTNMHQEEKGSDIKRWEMSGNKGDMWLLARINMPSIYDYNVVFEGTRGSSYRGDISIDDVRILSRECPSACKNLFSYLLHKGTHYNSNHFSS